MIELRGSHIVKVSREKIWPQIFDPQGLMKLIPGCQEIVETKPGEYHGEIRIGIAGVAGNYTTSVRIIRSNPPHDCSIEGEVIGKSGQIKGMAEFTIEEVDQSSHIVYSARGLATGALAKISPRFIASVVNTLIKLGLNNLK